MFNKWKFNLKVLDFYIPRFIIDINFSFLKKTDVIILMYDITNQISFEYITVYYNNIVKNSIKPLYYILVGNKCDEKEKREVSYEEGKNLAKQLNIFFFEISIKTGKNVKEIFYYLLNEICSSN